jgi:hypothetical protein
MGTFDALKTTAEVLRKADKIEEYKQILEVQQKLLEMKKKMMELEAENKILKEKLETKESTIFERNSYWCIRNGGKDGPFCSCCWDDERKMIRMQPCGNPAYFNCPRCKNGSVKVYPERDNPPITHVQTFDYM